MRLVTGTFSFDSSYPSGGESISALWDLINVRGIIFEQPTQTGTQTGKFVRADLANKKVQAFTNAQPYAEVSDTSDQSALANLRFIAWGY
jgi:hypothetical protein